MDLYPISRRLAGGLFSLLGRVKILHGERSARPGPYILAANHISHFDPPLISVAARRPVDWMAMADLYANRWAAAYFRQVHAISTDRSKTDRAAVRTALKRLREGRVVGIFPEGGIRAGSASLLEGARIRPGAVALAQMARVPVLPCVVLGTDRLYNLRRWMPLRRNTFWVGFGEAIEPQAGLPRDEAKAVLEKELTGALCALCRELQDTYRLSPGDLPKTPQARMEEP